MKTFSGLNFVFLVCGPFRTNVVTTTSDLFVFSSKLRAEMSAQKQKMISNPLMISKAQTKKHQFKFVYIVLIKDAQCFFSPFQ